MARILVADDERSMRELLEILLTREGHEVTCAAQGQKALALATAGDFDLVLTDLKMSGATGMDVLQAVKQKKPETEVIMITAFATTENAIQAMKAGAYDYLIKPFKVDEISLVVNKALEKRALVRENARLKRELGERPAGLVGRSPAMREVYALVAKVAAARTTLLISGESGTGKELVARAIHAASPRAEGPFVAINCGAIPEGLMESELFGHARGAFTGAQTEKKGVFGEGHGGTLLLDEVGEIPLLLQVKLLRAMQERKIKPLGAPEVEVDTRIIAATHRELAEEVKAGRFREDLYYRLNVINIRVPPLRERREDVLLLAEHFIARFCADMGKPVMRLSGAAAALLVDYAYPGNVRELENLVERAVTLAEGDAIGADALPPHLHGATPLPPAGDLAAGFDLQKHLDAIERAHLEKALAEAHGVKKEAARILGMTFRSFRYRLAKFGIGGEDKEALKGGEEDTA